MRAILYPFDSWVEYLEVTGDDFHHLCHVVRLTKSEKVLVLNGRGQTCFSEVIEIDKKRITLRLGLINKYTRKFCFDLAIAVPKKDAWELSLKYAAELGIRNVIALETKYSQRNISLTQSRIDSLFKTAIEQSNNPFLPNMNQGFKLENLDFKNYKKVFFFNSQTEDKKNDILIRKIGSDDNILIIIGPEGGFSNDEIEWILTHDNVYEVHIPTPILKTSTAVPVSVGFLIGELL